MDSTDVLTIGEAAARAGLATSTLRFYEAEGLIESERTEGNQRRYRRAELRRIALIRAAQSLGMSLAEVRSALDSLPEGRTPTKADWARLARQWRSNMMIGSRLCSDFGMRRHLLSAVGVFRCVAAVCTTPPTRSPRQARALAT